MQLRFMEELLRLEADAKSLLGMTDRSYEQQLMNELLKIMDVAEWLFGPRDRSFELLPPRITECGCAYPHIYPSRKIRIYLHAQSTTLPEATFQLAHEAVHTLGPTESWATVLEEGLATYFCVNYVKTEYGVDMGPPNRWYDAAMRAVAPLLVKDKFVIKELRARQPQLSKIDEKLLVEVTGIEPDQAKILCADFESSWLVGSTWGEQAVGGAKIFAKGVRSYWDLWKSV